MGIISFSTICPFNAEKYLRDNSYDWVGDEAKKHIIESIKNKEGKYRVQDPLMYQKPQIEIIGGYEVYKELLSLIKE